MSYYELKLDNTLKFKSLHTVYNTEWKPRLKLLSDFDIIFTKNNSINVICDSQHYALSPNEALFSFPGQTVYIPSEAERKTGISVLHFSCNYLKKYTAHDISERISKSDYVSIFDSSIILSKLIRLNNQYVHDTIDTMLDELKFKKYGYERKLNICLINILFELHRCCSEKIIYGNYPFNYRINNSYTRKLIDYIHSNYMNKITSKDIEKYLNLNYDYINRVFKQITGFSIMNYVDRIRITRAKELINTTSLRLCQISDLVGISDSHYFSRKFKQLEGYSPSKARKVNT
ncbi:MAG: helix-turn-helix domain-containing protein [Clostridia bacterium]